MAVCISVGDGGGSNDETEEYSQVLVNDALFTPKLTEFSAAARAIDHDVAESHARLVAAFTEGSEDG
jgi:hypothetical protein